MTCPAPPPVVSLQGRCQIFPNNLPFMRGRTFIRLLIEQDNHQLESFTTTSFSVRLTEMMQNHRWESDIMRHISFCPFQWISSLETFEIDLLNWFIEMDSLKPSIEMNQTNLLELIWFIPVNFCSFQRINSENFWEWIFELILWNGYFEPI